MSSHGITRADMHAVNLPRRRATNRLMEGLAWLAAAIAVGFLVLIVWSVARRGAGELNLDLITKTPRPVSSEAASKDWQMPSRAPSSSWPSQR